jgi:histidinol-phosphate/aromatic aminotransferase/cobyric acid decarboxylase-like protein
VNTLALISAGIAIKYDAQVRKYAETIRKNRTGFCSWLEARGIPYVPSSANFVLTRVGERAPEIAKLLRAEGILVRDWSYDPHLKGYLRFTIGSVAQTRRLMAELERFEQMIETRNAAKAWKDLVSYSSTGWFA